MYGSSLSPVLDTCGSLYQEQTCKWCSTVSLSSMVMNVHFSVCKTSFSKKQGNSVLIESPGCYVLQWKSHYFTDSLMCPAMHFVMVLMIEVTLLWSLVVRLRLLTIVRISREKHNIKT